MNLFDHDFRKYSFQFLAIIFLALLMISVVGGLNSNKDAENTATGQKVIDGN